MATKTGQTTKREPSTAPIPEFTAEEAKTVPDGDHAGVIENVTFEQRGDEGFKYVDVHIRLEEPDVVLRAGFAANRITNENDLGQLLQRFGWTFEKGAKVDVPSILVKGMDVRFTTKTEKNSDGRFARVVRETLRPA